MSILFHLAAALTVVSALSLLASDEAIRGAGRGIGGFATIFTGAYLLSLHGTLPAEPAGLVVLSWAVMAAGVLTVLSGVHKFRRRNLPQ